MPLLTRWFIRISFLYLLAALVAGVLLALRRVVDLPGVLLAIRPVYFHLFLVGWVTQLIFGTVYWLFPPWQGWPEPSGRMANWAVLALLNGGLLLRVVAEPSSVTQPGSIWGWLLVLSALLQWLAGMLFVVLVWPRARQRRKRSR